VISRRLAFTGEIIDPHIDEKPILIVTIQEHRDSGKKRAGLQGIPTPFFDVSNVFVKLRENTKNPALKDGVFMHLFER